MNYSPKIGIIVHLLLRFPPRRKLYARVDDDATMMEQDSSRPIECIKCIKISYSKTEVLNFGIIRFVLAFFAKIIRETIDFVKITSKYTRGHSFKYTISLLRGVGLV